MNTRRLSSLVVAIALGAAASAMGVAASGQDANTPPPSAPQQAQGQGAGQGSGQGQGGQRGGGRGGWGGGMGMGRGLMGSVTEVAADHYTVKTEAGETYTVHYSANTRILKQPPQQRGESAGGGGQRGGGGNPPTPIKSTDIKVGDAIAAMGDVDATAKSIGAVTVMQIDPARAKQMREMQANYGKTWLQGKVTAIDGVKVTLTGSVDNKPYSFVADENTTFRKRRDPITLADIQVGDTVRAEGAIKDGAFLATAVSAMGPQSGGPAGSPGGGPRNGPPAAQPPQ
jgi:hypothetical protein